METTTIIADPIKVVEETTKPKGFGTKTKIVLLTVAAAGLAYYLYDKSDDKEKTTEETE